MDGHYIYMLFYLDGHCIQIIMVMIYRTYYIDGHDIQVILY